MMLADAINHIDSAKEPFSLKVVKYNAALNKGGDFLFIPNCIKLSSKNSKPVLRNENLDHNKIVKNPNHYANATRNLRDLNTGNTIKIHIWLIVELNGQPVKL